MLSELDRLKGLVKENRAHSKDIRTTLKYSELFVGLRPAFAPSVSASPYTSVQLGVLSLLGGYDKDIYLKYGIKSLALKLVLFCYCFQGSDGFAPRKVLFKMLVDMGMCANINFQRNDKFLVEFGFFERERRGKAIFYKLTPKGVQVAEYYQNRINVIIHNLSYMMQNDEEIRKLF